MIYKLRYTLIALVICNIAVVCRADWNAAPSYYTHDARGRVNQFARPTRAMAVAETGRRSYYRSTRSSLQVGASADHLHTVDEVGAPITPYGEWRFPNRPYSVPYPGWGPQLPLYGGFGFGGGGGGGGAPLNLNLTPYGTGPFNDRSGSQPPFHDGRYPRDRIPPRLP